MNPTQKQFSLNAERPESKFLSVKTERDSLATAQERFLALDPGKQAKAIQAFKDLQSGGALTQQQVGSLSDFRENLGTQDQERLQAERERILKEKLQPLGAEGLFAGTREKIKGLEELEIKAKIEVEAKGVAIVKLEADTQKTIKEINAERPESKFLSVTCSDYLQRP